uniref:Arginine/serine-rich protein PNISR n=1 Tax=Stomoxys calcitrans TaxID=35570 RepID=A0A1I8PNW9_STOCA
MSGYQFINQAAVANAMASGHNIDWAQLAQQWIQMRDSAKSETSSAKYDEKGEADMDIEEQVEKDNNDRSLKAMPHSSDDSNINWSSRPETGGAEGSFILHRSTNQWNKWGSNHSKTHYDASLPKRPTNPTSHIPSLLKINVPHPNEIRSLPDGPSDPQNSSNTMDASKRKVLPAWIREGLEKMEREKQKQQEKKSFRISDDESAKFPLFEEANSDRLNLNNDIDSSPETEETEAVEKCPRQGLPNEDVSSEDLEVIVEQSRETYEQRLSNLMVVVRQTLTELLLEVTNEEIAKIANETVKNYKLKASSAQVIQQSALSSITGKLGLAVYGDSSSSEEDDNETNIQSKTFPSESDSEEDIKVSLRLKKRSFLKIANEIEDKVAAAAAREGEKLKNMSCAVENDSATNKSKTCESATGMEKTNMVTSESVSAHSSSGGREKMFGKINERDSGETTDTKLQILNGKRHKDRGTLKERTTRFSDNRDANYITMTATATSIVEQSKGNIFTSGISQTVTSQSQAVCTKNNVLPSYNYPAIAANFKALDDTLPTLRQKKSSDPEKDPEHEGRRKYEKRKRHGDDSSSSSSFSSSTSSSSETSSTGSSSSESSDVSKYDRRRSGTKKHSSHSRSSRDNYDKYDKSSYSRNRYKHDSDSDDTYRSRRKRSSRSRYSSHSRSRSRSHRDNSRSHSRSSYSYSGKRRH